jgi:proteasome lid subunit RPN8/RPN11
MLTKIKGIDRSLLEMINQAAKDSLPNEFMAMLRVEEGVVQELLLVPGTLQGKDSALVMLHMLPIDFTVVGTVHSHPGFSNRPSSADLDLFRHYGSLHIITCMPFDEKSWQAYDHEGQKARLPIVDL